MLLLVANPTCPDNVNVIVIYLAMIPRIFSAIKIPPNPNICKPSLLFKKYNNILIMFFVNQGTTPLIIYSHLPSVPWKWSTNSF